MHIASVGTGFPPHFYTQPQLIEALKRYWGAHFHNPARLEMLHQNVCVGGRHLALPLDAYPALTSFTQANNAFIEVAVDVGAKAMQAALRQAGLAPGDVDHLFFVSVTGVATPSIDARLVNRLGLRTDVKRTPIFGLGCVAGAAGVARVADYLRGFPSHTAVLLSVELCSLTLQRQDVSIPNLIASGLFGDGAAAVVMRGAHPAQPGPRVVATRSRFYPDTENVMGWEVTSEGFKVVLSADVPAMVARYAREDADTFLAAHGLHRRDIHTFICHTGGPKVLEAFEQALEIPRAALQRSWDSLQAVGNLSSASVLMVLGDVLEQAPPPPGSYGLMVAMGPGFCSEWVLLQW